MVGLKTLLKAERDGRKQAVLRGFRRWIHRLKLAGGTVTKARKETGGKAAVMRKAEVQSGQRELAGCGRMMCK